MRYDLRRADARVKWLVTLVLATLGLSYLFGAWMVALYAGFTPGSVAATYTEAQTAMPMPPESTIVLEHEMTLADFTEATPHRVDRDLLVQDTHVHLPMYGVIAALLSVVVLGLTLPAWASYGLITLLFTAPWLDFAGMWLTKLGSAQFAIVTLLGGWAMAFGYTAVTALALWQMWRPANGGTP